MINIYVYLSTEDNMAREIGELKNNMARFCLSNFYFLDELASLRPLMEIK